MAGGFTLFGDRVDGILRDFPYGVCIKFMAALFVLQLFTTPVFGLVSFRRAGDPGYLARLAPLIIGGDLLLLFASTVAMIGFLKAALDYESRLVGYSSALLMALGFIFEVPVIVFELARFTGSPASESASMIFYLIVALSAGILSIAWGVGVYRLGEKKLFKAVGVYSVLLGIIFSTVIFAFIGSFLAIPLAALDAYLLDTIRKDLGKE